MSEANIQSVNDIFKQIENTSVEIKLELIKKIAESLKSNVNAEITNRGHLFGAWVSEKSAEQIISEIRASRYSDRKIEEL